MLRAFVFALLVLQMAAPASAQDSWVAIVGGTVFDGTGAVLDPGIVLIRGGRIEAVGPASDLPVPRGAARLDAGGRFVLPGMVDLHFHYGLDTPWLPSLFLANGVTTMRETGRDAAANRQWLDGAGAQGLPAPRLHWTGPLLDGPDPAHPRLSIVLSDEAHTRMVANELIDAGATSLKVYFRLPTPLIRAVVEEGHRRGVPVHGHLEIVDARDAIHLGLDGVEHVTSLGRALVEDTIGEAYERALLEANSARHAWRYRMWAGVDPDGEAATQLMDLMLERRVNLTPTLAIMEPALEADDERHKAAANMAALTLRYYRAGGRVTVGSHGVVPHVLPGLAFHRELELLVNAGMTPGEALQAATSAGAEALRLEDRGVLAPGRVADLVIVEGNPLHDIRDLRRVHAVMLGGEVLDREALLATAPLLAASGASVTAFVDVTVLTMSSDRPAPRQTVLVEDGRISGMGPVDEMAVPEGALRIQGQGRYLVPGLIDMHVHPNQDDLALYLANGVTTARIMNGSPAALFWRDRIRLGALPGPRLVVAGPTIRGRPPPGFEELILGGGPNAPETYEDGVAVVDRQVAQGYDFIKVYNNVTAEAYRGIVDAARRHGVDVTGHVPFSVGLQGALEAGQRTIEHLRGYVQELVPPEASDRPGPDMRSRAIAWRHADRSRIEALARATAAAGAWNCPTLTVRGAIPSEGLASFIADPQTRYLRRDVRLRMANRWGGGGWIANFTEPDFRAAAQGRAVQAELLRALRDHGAPLCAGTDTPVAGFALHGELALLVEAGLTPFEALDAATRSAADAMGRDDLGRIVVGARADLLLVRGNPLDDLGVLAAPEGVMAGGRWLPRTALDTFLEAAASWNDRVVMIADAGDPAGAVPVARGMMVRLSPDGARLYRVPDGFDQDTVVVLDPDADRPHVALMAPLLVSEPDGGGSRVLAELVRVDGTQPSYDVSPDGQTVAYAGMHGDPPRSAIFTVSAGGGEPRLLVAVPEAVGTAPRWSPDGERIAFAAGEGLYVVEVEGGAVRRLADAPAWQSDVSWSPDGRRIAAARFSVPARESTVVIVNVETGAYHRVSEPELDGHYKEGVTWHPDGERLSYMCYCAPDHPRLGYADGRPGEALVDLPDHWVWFGVWRPDGRTFLFLAWGDDEGGLFEMDMETGVSTHIRDASHLPAWGGGRMVWSAPDPGG